MNNPINLPVQPVQNPIIATNRWLMIKDDARQIVYIQKDYLFDSIDKFTLFLHDIIDYQASIQHLADIQTSIVEKQYKVEISLWTRNLNQCTNIDKEFAKYCDITYKNLFTNNEYTV